MNLSRVMLAGLAAATLALGACQKHASDEPVVVQPPAAEIAPQAEPVAAPVEPAPGPGVLSAYVWQCEDGRDLTMRNLVAKHAIVLVLPEGERRLAHVESASGAKYQEGDLSFWTKGREALLEQGGNPAIRCEEVRALSLRADAKARGVVFRGMGNEPGWTIEIGAYDRISLQYDYGSVRAEFPPLQPQADASDGIVYSGQTEEHSIRVLLREQPCNDDMSGEPFPWTVELEFDGQARRGCGTRL